ncbi:SAM-dependent methyltransferase [Amycolatopsis sp. H20-H5]|uniref:SAM-dependent methyltransferase n=1 Tax=Amycolatopsis sp. H20-H5 TaxID=3046309 RepID=UPI002DBEBAB5|nr:SAM-dependent methyltransferase [Amycolatopsis sp. H20-H5]MEC3978061.1 SAM-dependent methyltransferase [Amycolatopsis sp. H20-H5]
MVEFEEEPFPPPGVDLEHPSVARVYDYYLGGHANWTIDRQFGDQVLEAFPLLKPIAKANRLFLHKVVRHLVGLGVRQFIDIGSGVPTMGHAHQIADDVAPGEVHVAYVDYEPVAVAHSQSLLKDNGDPSRHVAIHADLRDPDRLWDKIRDSGVIDLDEPVALLLIAVLHVQQPPPAGTDGDDLGPSAVARYRDLLPPQSFLALSHLTDEGVPPEFGDKLRQLKRMYDEASSPVIWRSHDQIAQLFGDFTMVEPGLTWTPLWHPEHAENSALRTDFATPNQSAILAGVARKS